MDEEGIAVQVLYPDLVMVDPDIHDRELASAMARAFNVTLSNEAATPSV